jgi:hypothetical protein
MPDDVINTKLARALLSKRQFEALLTLERWRFDAKGLAYWLPEEWPVNPPGDRSRIARRRGDRGRADARIPVKREGPPGRHPRRPG